MDDHVEQDESGRIESVDTQIIKKLYKQYEAINEKLPEARPAPIKSTDESKQVIFVLDRRDDEHTKFKGEEISCYKSKLPVQKLLDSWPPFAYNMDRVDALVGKPQSGENWILVTISPGDLYRPKFAKHKSSSGFEGDTEKDLWWLESDELVIAFSDTGKALEARIWKSFGKTKRKDIDEVKHGRDRLKEDISLEGLQEINTATTFSEPLQPIQGTTLERLQYIAHQASLGNIADWTEVFQEGSKIRLDNS